MEDNDLIRQIGFEQVKDNQAMDYIDETIAVHADIRELPIENGSIQMDMMGITICTNGKLQLELNTEPYTIHKNEVMIFFPNTIIDNCMLSPDFCGAILCLSRRGMMDLISENELWNNAFRYAKNPVIRISDESHQMLKLYSTMLMAKIKMKGSAYQKKIIGSIVNAMLYELLGNMKKDSDPYEIGLTSQREVLFKKFIKLLSTTRIRSRNVSWYAERLCVTPKYLSTVSKQVSGKTAFAWINEFILKDIRYWLKNSDKTIKEIAELLKFPSISFFGKYCRSHFGVSPTECRKRLREDSVKNRRSDHGI